MYESDDGWTYVVGGSEGESSDEKPPQDVNICLVAFLWKTTDSFINYLDKDIGTKIILKRNYEATLPAFAICRNPNR